MQFFNWRAQRKRDDEKETGDEGPLHEGYPGQLAILADKGYQGAAEFCRNFHPKCKPQGGFLSPGEVAENKVISSNIIIVENHVGRLCGLWNVIGCKWKWSEEHYDPVFRLCLGLTNFNIRWKPLREQDMSLYQQLTSRWYSIGNSQLERRRRIQKNYREKRANILMRQFRASSVLDLPGREPREDC